MARHCLLQVLALEQEEDRALELEAEAGMVEVLDGPQEEVQDMFILQVLLRTIHQVAY